MIGNPGQALGVALGRDLKDSVLRSRYLTKLTPWLDVQKAQGLLEVAFECKQILTREGDPLAIHYPPWNQATIAASTLNPRRTLSIQPNLQKGKKLKSIARKPSF